MLGKRKVLRFKDNKLIEELEEIKEKKEDPAEKKRSAQILSLAGELGYTISLPLVIGALLGRVLDNKFNSSPKLTLFFIFAGILIGGANIYFIFKKMK